MAVAYLAERRYCASASLTVVAVNGSISLGSKEYRLIFLNADNVLEVNIEQHVNAGISHILAPQEFA